jgi:Protein of unknown function (DUF2934)
MTAKPKSLRPRSPKPDLPSNAEECIRRLVYELYEQRGRVDGFSFDDWLQAERQILDAQKRRKVKAARATGRPSRRHRNSRTMEMPIMLAVTIVAACWTVVCLSVPMMWSARLKMGRIALGLMLIAEFGFARGFGVSR